MTAPSDRRDRSEIFCVRAGFSLVEALVAITILGFVLAIAIPAIGRLVEGASSTVAKQNALTTASVSGGLSAAGVAHVLPESLGGAEATTRLLRHGITVPDGALAGTVFSLPSLSEAEVAPTAVYLQIIFDQTILRMVYDDEE